MHGQSFVALTEYAAIYHKETRSTAALAAAGEDTEQNHHVVNCSVRTEDFLSRLDTSQLGLEHVETLY